MIKRVTAFLCAAVILIFAVSYPVSALTNVYRHSSAQIKKIALTFDDGPHPRYTPKILKILDEYKIKATFFVIGQNIENYPETAKLLAGSGCEIGNHTFSHKNIRKLEPKDIALEMKKCRDVLRDVCGVSTHLIRPPEGAYNTALEELCDDGDYSIILWNIDTRDWAHTPVEDIVKNIYDNVKGGDIILMHDYISGYSPTCEVLSIIIPELIEKGYEFVTVSELIGCCA